MDNKQTTNGSGLLGVVQIVFLVLKLSGTVDWAWWLVLLPLIIELSMLVILGIVIGIISFLDR